MALCFRFIPLACILVYQITGISFAAPIDFSQGAWTVSPSVVSQYVFRGVKFADASLQPSIEGHKYSKVPNIYKIEINTEGKENAADTTAYHTYK